MAISSSRPDERYRIFIDNGREIQEPLEPLKSVQDAFVQRSGHLLCFDSCVYGGVPSKSALLCAKRHCDAQYILKMDLKSFYRTVTYDKIVEEIMCWRSEFLHNDDLDSFLWEIQHRLPEFFCNGTPYQILPTGAPTSMLLANLAARSLDKKIKAFFASSAWTESPEHYCPVNPVYTRYVDDLTFSMPRHSIEYSKPWVLISMIEDLVKSEGFLVNTAKTRWMTRGADNMNVLGVNVTHRQTKVPRKFRRDLRATLFKKAKNKNELSEQDAGRLSYVKEVDQDQYYKLLRYYEKCRL